MLTNQILANLQIGCNELYGNKISQILLFYIFFFLSFDKVKNLCYNAVMEKKLYQCLDSIEICGRKLKCRFDINNWHVMHNHDFWEIMIVTEGTYPQIINGEKLIMRKNAALLLKPSDVHIVQQSSPNDSHINIVINVDFMKEVCDFFDPNLFDTLSVSSPQVLYLSASQFSNIFDIILNTILVE